MPNRLLLSPKRPETLIKKRKTRQLLRHKLEPSKLNQRLLKLLLLLSLRLLKQEFKLNLKLRSQLKLIRCLQKKEKKN